MASLDERIQRAMSGASPTGAPTPTQTTTTNKSLDERIAAAQQSVMSNSAPKPTPSPAPVVQTPKPEVVTEEKDDDRNLWDKIKSWFTPEDEQAQPTTLQTTNKSTTAEDEDVTNYLNTINTNASEATAKTPGDNANYIVKDFGASAAQKLQDVGNEVSYWMQNVKASAPQIAAGGAAMASAFSNNEMVDEMAKQRQAEAQEAALTPLETTFRFGDKAKEKVATQYEDKVSDLAKNTAQLTSAIGYMLPDIAVSPLGAARLISALGIAGGATKEALDAGVDKGRATIKGAALGGLTAALDSAIDGMAGIYGKGSLDDVVRDKLIKRVTTNPNAEKALMGLYGVVGEGFEELVEEVATRLINEGVIDLGTNYNFDNRSGKETAKDAGLSFLMGAAVSGLVNVGGKVLRGSVTTTDPKALADEVVAEIKANPETIATQGEISPSGGVSSQPTTDTTKAENIVQDNQGMPGFESNENVASDDGLGVNTLTDAPIFSGKGVGAAAPVQGETVPSEFALKESEWGTPEMRDAIEPPTHERVSREIRHARAQGKLITDADGNILYAAETADDLLDSDSWSRVDQTLATSYLAPELYKKGDMDRYQALVQRIARNRSEAGGMLQEAQDYPRTPEGKVVQAVQAVNSMNEQKNSKADKNRTNVGGTAKAAKKIVEDEVESAAEAAETKAIQVVDINRKRPAKVDSKGGLNEDGTFKTGTRVRAKDRGNIGVIVSYDPATNTYMVRFTAKSGATRTLPMTPDQFEALTGGKSTKKPSTPETLSGKTLGEQLAEKLLYRAEDQTEAPSEEQKALSTLVQFATDSGAPKGERAKPMTAAERLKHYFANRAAYHTAWDEMQRIVGDKGDVNAFENILATSNEDAKAGTIIRAIIEGSKNLGIDKNSIRNYAALDAENAVAKKLAADLIAELGVQGVDAQHIEAAVAEYITKLANEDAVSDRAGNILNKSANATGIKLGDVLKQSWQDKAKARDAIVKYVTSEYGLTGDEAIAAAEVMAQRFYNELAERSQRALETRFKPRGRRKSRTQYERFAELLINMDAVNDDVFRDLAVQSIYGEDIQLTKEEIQEIHLIMEEAVANRGTNPRRADELEAQANAIIASKMPRTFKNKLITSLYNSMLGNIKTLVARNAGGNIGLALVEQGPTKFLTAAADAAIGKLTGERYHAMPTADYYKAYGKGFVKGAKDFARDFSLDIHTPRSGEEATVEMQYKPFKTQFMNEINKLVRGGLELGDRPFYEAQYAARMEELSRLKSSGKLSEEQAAEFDEWAPVAAQLDALAAVFQTKNTKNNPEAAKTSEGLKKLKEAVNGIVQGVTGIDIAGQAALPFTSTPGNILETFSDYAPGLGLVKNIAQSGREIREGRFDQSRAAKQLGRQATGALLWGAAGALAGSGLISGGGNEEDKELLEQSGWQEYSVKIGDKWYGYDWIPIVGPLMAGAADFRDAKEKGDANFLDALGTAAGTVTEMSALQGLNRLFGGYGNTVSGFADALMGLPAQGIPSLMRQFAKTKDEYERMTYDPNAIVNELKYIASGVPFLRETLPEAMDMFGNPVKAGDGRGYGSRAIENFLSPGWLSEEQNDPLTNELLRLADTGNSVGISTIGKTYTDNNGRTVKMSAEQYHNYQVTRGTTMAEIMEDVLSNPNYSKLTDAQKSEAMSYAVDIANAAAKVELYSELGLAYDNEYEKVLELGSNMGEYVFAHEAFSEAYNAYSTKKPVNAADAKALDAILPSVKNYNADVYDMLMDTTGFKALSEANAAGMKTQTYFAIKDATRGLSKAWQKNEAIVGMSGVSDNDKLIAIQLNSDSEAMRGKWQAAYDAGYPLETIVAYYSSEQLKGADGKKLPIQQRKNAALESMNVAEYNALKNIFSD